MTSHEHADAESDQPLDLPARPGLPSSLTFLYDQYPRSLWQGHANLGDVARFWLQRHDMFREFATGLHEAARLLQEGKVPATRFRGWFVPRIGFFLQQLHHHHQVEDLHYFPLFQAAEKRLARGFEILDSDHKFIDRALHDLQGCNSLLQQALAGRPAGIEAASMAMAAELQAFLQTLKRHLEDEEDLIVPLILDRGERQLGVL